MRELRIVMPVDIHRSLLQLVPVFQDHTNIPQRVKATGKQPDRRPVRE